MLIAMRKGFQFIPQEDVLTPVTDKVSAMIPDQSIGLRELMLKFAYIGNERLEDIVNRGFDGDEDDDLLGVDVGALDYSEVHDRIIELHDQSTARSVHADERSVVPQQPTVPEEKESSPDGVE